jgi:hypothetical protein
MRNLDECKEKPKFPITQLIQIIVIIGVLFVYRRIPGSLLPE